MMVLIEGIGDEVFFSLSTIFLILCLIAVGCFYFLPLEVSSGTRDTYIQISTNHQCPICIEDLSLPLRTNCGHVFCGMCLKQAYDSGPSGNLLLSCPLCRQKVTILFHCFRTPVQGSEQRNEVLVFAQTYNQHAMVLTSDIWTILRNTPILLRHYFNRVLEEGFSSHFLLVRALGSLFLVFLYCVIPLDLIPEHFFGFLGYLDDLAVLLYCLVHLGLIYHNFMIVNNPN